MFVEVAERVGEDDGASGTTNYLCPFDNRMHEYNVETKTWTEFVWTGVRWTRAEQAHE